MGVSLREDGPTFKVGCPGERLVNVALPDGVPSQARQLRDDRHLTASRHPGQEAVDIPQSLSAVQAPFKRRARWFGRGAGFAACGLYRQNALKMADSVDGAPWHSKRSLDERSDIRDSLTSRISRSCRLLANPPFYGLYFLARLVV
jgi:hypothetical protein